MEVKVRIKVKGHSNHLLVEGRIKDDLSFMT